MASTNYIKLMFMFIAAITFLPGLLVTYGEKYFPSIIVRFVHYGRKNLKKNNGKTNLLRFIEVPKNWFYHCYLSSAVSQAVLFCSVVYVYEHKMSTSWLRTALTIFGGDDRPTSVSASTTILAVVLFFCHVTRRAYETLFVSVFSNTKMNVMHYSMAWLHYTGSMLAIVSCSPGFSSSPTNFEEYSWSISQLTLVDVICFLIYIYGSWTTFQAHSILANLRKAKDNTIATMKHKIPYGGMFEKVSCPNYWGEVLIYVAFALLFRLTNTTWNYITTWVVVNQIVVGVMNHRWYHETFPEYPKERKAVIPYVW